LAANFLYADSASIPFNIQPTSLGQTDWKQKYMAGFHLIQWKQETYQEKR